MKPQPNLTVIRPRDYTESLSVPEDVLLLIEVSDTTLAYDRKVKLPLYARADLPAETIERYAEPSTDGYRCTERKRRGETLQPVALPTLTTSVDDVLG